MASCIHCGHPMIPNKGLCQKCGGFSFSETGNVGGAVGKKQTTTLDQVSATSVDRIVTGGPWDVAWGGGFVPTSITLLGGAPGAGKTTLLLQLSSVFAKITGKRSFYLSAEQPAGELRITADRLKIDNIERLRVLTDFGTGAEIEEELFKDDPPGMIILDSITSLCGKDAHAAIVICKRYRDYASKYKAPAFLIAHMTKEGDFAGLMTLQHEVSTLVTLFPEEDGSRVLKPWKNRFGPTHGEYKLIMTQTGLAAMPEKAERGKKRGNLTLVPALPPEPLTPGEIAATGTADDPLPMPPEMEAQLAQSEKRGRVRRELPPPADGLVKVKKGEGGKMKRADGKPARAKKEVREEDVLVTAETISRARAIEGEALKRKRTPMPKRAASKSRRDDKTRAKKTKAKITKGKRENTQHVR